MAPCPLILEFPADSAGYGREIFDRISKRELPGSGSPADIAEQIVEYDRKVGGFEDASLQVNFNTLARDSVALFGREVIARLR